MLAPMPTVRSQHCTVSTERALRSTVWLQAGSSGSVRRGRVHRAPTNQFHKQRRYPKPASGVNRQPAPALLLTITPTTAKVQIPTRYGPRRFAVNATPQPDSPSPSTPAAAPPKPQPPPSSQSGALDLQQLCTDYDLANPAPLGVRSRHVARRLKALSQGDPWAYDIFKQDGKAFVEGNISATEFRDRYISIFGRSGDAEVAFLEISMAVPQMQKRCQLLRTMPLGLLQMFSARVSSGKEAAMAARRVRRDELLAAWEAGEIDGEEALRLGLAELDDEDDEAWGRVEVQEPSGPAWNAPFTEQDVEETAPQLRNTYLVGWQPLDRERIDAYVQDFMEEATQAPSAPTSQAAGSGGAGSQGAGPGDSDSAASDSAESGAAEGVAAGGEQQQASRVLWDPEGAAVAGEGVHLNSLSAIPARKLPSRRGGSRSDA